MVWLGPVVVVLVWITITLKEGSNWIGPPAYFTTAILLMIWIKLGIAVEAGQAFCEDRRSGTLALLLTTPLTVREIVRGQGLALRRQFLGPLGMTLGVSFLFLLLTLADHSVSDEYFVLTALWVALMVLLVADSTALAILGMWMGLKHRNINRAAGATISRLLVLPWMIYILGIRALPWALYATGISSILWADLYSGWFFLGLWFFPGLLADALFGVWAWRKLHEEFRRAVGEPLPAAVACGGSLPNNSAAHRPRPRRRSDSGPIFRECPRDRFRRREQTGCSQPTPRAGVRPGPGAGCARDTADGPGVCPPAAGPAR